MVTQQNTSNSCVETPDEETNKRKRDVEKRHIKSVFLPYCDEIASITTVANREIRIFVCHYHYGCCRRLTFVVVVVAVNILIVIVVVESTK